MTKQLTDGQKSIIRRHAESLLADDESSLWGRWLGQMLRIIDAQAEALKAPMTWALQQVAEEMQKHAADRAALVAQLEAANDENQRLRTRLRDEQTWRAENEALIKAAHDDLTHERSEHAISESLRQIAAEDRAALVYQLEASELRAGGLAQSFEAAVDKLTAAQARVAELTRERDEARDKLQMQQTAQHVEGLHWEARVTRLTDALAAAERELTPEHAYFPDRSYKAMRERAEAAEARALELEAENVRLRNDPMSQRAYSAEARVRELTEALAAAERGKEWQLFEHRALSAEARVRELEAELAKEAELRTHWYKAFEQQASRVRELEELLDMAGTGKGRAEALATEWQQTAESQRLEFHTLMMDYQNLKARMELAITQCHDGNTLDAGQVKLILSGNP